MFTMKRFNVVKQVETAQAKLALEDKGFKDITPEAPKGKKGDKENEDQGKEE